MSSSSSQLWLPSHTRKSTRMGTGEAGKIPTERREGRKLLYPQQNVQRSLRFWKIRLDSFLSKWCWFKPPLPSLATPSGTKTRSAEGAAMLFLASTQAGSVINLARKPRLMGFPEPIRPFMRIRSFRQTSDPQVLMKDVTVWEHSCLLGKSYSFKVPNHIRTCRTSKDIKGA